MSEIWWNVQIAYWFWRKSNMTVPESWQYAKCMDREYWSEADARTAVETEMSYWEN